MLIIPAIDIQNGKCVRLWQGNFNQEIIYDNDPVVVAKKWQAAGAKMLHIVDLDGARNGQAANFNIIAKITKTVDLPVQIGGGIRSKSTVRRLLSAGVSKVIIGTLALENLNLLKRLLDSYADQIVVSLDSKENKLAKWGWVNETKMDLITTAQRLENLGVKQFIYTDVTKDGTLSQPNYAGIKSLLAAISIPLIVAGGVASLSDIKKLKTLQVSGVIIGKALYENKINLEEANYVS
jgi:phosphoribosylformimino-5-aminoimidazole carboxamide ribotide isomerase